LDRPDFPFSILRALVTNALRGSASRTFANAPRASASPSAERQSHGMHRAAARTSIRGMHGAAALIVPFRGAETAWKPALQRSWHGGRSRNPELQPPTAKRPQPQLKHTGVMSQNRDSRSFHPAPTNRPNPTPPPLAESRDCGMLVAEMARPEKVQWQPGKRRANPVPRSPNPTKGNLINRDLVGLPWICSGGLLPRVPQIRPTITLIHLDSPIHPLTASRCLHWAIDSATAGQSLGCHREARRRDHPSPSRPLSKPPLINLCVSAASAF